MSTKIEDAAKVVFQPSGRRATVPKGTTINASNGGEQFPDTYNKFLAGKTTPYVVPN